MLTRRPRGYTACRLKDAAASWNIPLTLLDPMQVRLPLRRSPWDGVWLRPGGPHTAHGLAALEGLAALGCVDLHDANALGRFHPPWRALGTLAAAGLPVTPHVTLGQREPLGPAVLALGPPPWRLTAVSGQGLVTEVVCQTRASSQASLQVLLRWGGRVMVTPVESTRLRFLVAFGCALASLRCGQDGPVEEAGGAHTQPGERLALAACAALQLRVAGVDVTLGRRHGAITMITASPSIHAAEVLTGRDMARPLLEGWAAYTKGSMAHINGG